jgi:hypothetical protein
MSESRISAPASDLATRPLATPATGRRVPDAPRRPKQRRFNADPGPLPAGAIPTPGALPAPGSGPLRSGAPTPGDASRGAPAAMDPCLQDRGVVQLQLREVGDHTEVCVRIRQGDGLVEAALRETPRGVEIRLAGEPDQLPLLDRVAESLARRSDDHAFLLDGVDVSTGDPPGERRRPAPRPGDRALTSRSMPRARSRHAAILRSPSTSADATTGYLR